MDKSLAPSASLHAKAHMRRSLPHINPSNIEPSASFSQGFRDYFLIENSPTESLFGDMEPQYAPSVADHDIFEYNYPGYGFSDRESVGRPAVPYAVERPDTIIQQSPDAHLPSLASPIEAPRPLHSKMSPLYSFNEWQQPSIFVQPNSMESLLSDTSSNASDSSFGISSHTTQPQVCGEVTSKQKQLRRRDAPSVGRTSGTIMPSLSPVSDMDLYSFNGPQQRRLSLPIPNELDKPPVSVARPGMYTSTSCPNTIESLDFTIPTTNIYSTTLPDAVSDTEAHTVYSPQNQAESQQSMPVSMPMALRLYSDPTMYIGGPASASNSSSISPGRDNHNINPSEWSPILAFRNMAVGDGQGVCNPQHVNGDMSRDEGPRVSLHSDYDTSRSEENVVGDARKPRLSADAGGWGELDLWDDDYADDDDEDDEDYEDECDDGDNDDDGEYVFSRRRSFVAGSSHDLRPRRRSSAGMTSARYHPYPDSSDASSAHATMPTSSSSPALMSLPKPKVTRQPNSVPIPVPNLTKKSRGRRVPTIDSLTSGDKCRKNKSSIDKNEGESKNPRIFVCDTVGCGKCFARGEHLKRHVRSIHTHEKPHTCPHSDCDKSFSRYDNLRQHLRVHKDYFTEKDDISGMYA